MREINYMEKSAEFMEQMSKGGGAFLTVQHGDEKNTMTIGWGQIGIIWGRPILSVMVRLTRHTFKLIEEADDFTVSIPWEDMKKELAYCGSKSGADVDKFAECDLKAISAQKVKTPIIAMKGLHYECKTLLKSAMDPALMDTEIDTKIYPKKDYHTVYFGEIMACYETD
ncbi:MAG: flavin reductase family protein [Candidatus Sumerlaeia bacterium]